MLLVEHDVEHDEDARELARTIRAAADPPDLVSAVVAALSRPTPTGAR